MKMIKGLILASLALALTQAVVAAPPTNPGQQRNQKAQTRGKDRVKERLGQSRSTERGRSADRGRSDKTGRPEKAGRPERETKGSARSVLVNKGQNKLARINADKILAKRLAQVEHLRDVALNNGNEELLAKTDELEQIAREDYTRRTGLSSLPADPEPTDPGTTPPATEPVPTEPAPTDPVQ